MKRLATLRFLLPALMLVFLLAAVAITILGGLVERRNDLLLEAQADSLRDASLLVEVAEHTLAAGASGRPDLLADSVARLATDPRVAVAAVIDAQGRVSLSTNRVWDGQSANQLPGFSASQFERARQGRAAVLARDAGGDRQFVMMSYALPAAAAELRGFKRGVVYLAYDLSGTLRDARADAWSQRWPELGLLLLVAGLLSALVRRLITRPMAQMTRAVRLVAAGDFKHRLEDSGPQEFRALAHAFNDMSAKLAESIAQYASQTQKLQVLLEEHQQMALQREQVEVQIRVLNATLEERVRERTAEMEAALRELESFSYSVSHDLRAPLRAIDGFSRIVIEDHAAQLDPEARDYLDRVRRAVQRMGAQIDDLLELSRIGRADMRVVDIDLSRLAGEVLEQQHAAEPARAVQVTITPALRGRGDERLLRLVLQNLLGNAWKYTRRTAAARIEFDRANEDGDAVYCIRDNGAGFDMAYVDKLFHPFQRLHRADEFEGTGVGLAIVARIVQRHGGRVWAEAAPGAGAAFYFTLAPTGGAT